MAVLICLPVVLAFGVAVLLPGCGNTSNGSLLFSSGLVPYTVGSGGNPTPPPASNTDDNTDTGGGGGSGSGTDPICITFQNDADDPAKIALYTSTNQNASVTTLLAQTPEWLPANDQPCVLADNLVGTRDYSVVIQNGDQLRYQVECGFANAMLILVAGESDPILSGAFDDLLPLVVNTDYACGDSLTLTITQDAGSGDFQIGF